MTPDVPQRLDAQFGFDIVNERHCRDDECPVDAHDFCVVLGGADPTPESAADIVHGVEYAHTVGGVAKFDLTNDAVDAAATVQIGDDEVAVRETEDGYEAEAVRDPFLDFLDDEFGSCTKNAVHEDDRDDAPCDCDAVLVSSHGLFPQSFMQSVADHDDVRISWAQIGSNDDDIMLGVYDRRDQ